MITKSISISEDLWQEFKETVEIRKDELRLSSLPVSTAISEALLMYIKKHG